MITGDDPTITIIIWVLTTVLIIIGELMSRSILARLPRLWRMAAYVLIGADIAIILTTFGAAIAAILKRYPWL